MKAKNMDLMRAQAVEILRNSLVQAYPEVLKVAGGQFDIPVVAPDGEEGYVSFNVIVRKGARDGSGYNPYDLADAYEENLKIQAAKAEAKAEAREAESKRKQAERLAKEAERKAKADAKAAKAKAEAE